MLSLVVLALLAQNAPTPPAQNGALHGVVRRAGTIEALAKTVVELRGDDDRMPPLVSTTTEADGRFAFRSLRPGGYRLVASRPGFVGRSVSVSVSNGATETLVIAMTGTGAIAGRVYGPDGEGLGNISVAALRSSYQNGQRVFTAVQSVRSNERGEYRLFWLAPGRYIVRATHPRAETGAMAFVGQAGTFGGIQIMSNGGLGPNGIFQIRSTGDAVLFDAFGPGGDSLPDRYVPVYFPGTNDDQSASVIDVRAGAEVSAIDVPVIPVHERHVRGVVINGATGQVAQYAGLTEVRANALPGGPIGGPGGGLSNDGLAAIDADGSFDVTLLPGRHTLMGTAFTGVGYLSLDVRDADLDGVRIVASPEFNVPGRIGTDAPVEKADLGNVRIRLRRELPLPITSSSYSLPRGDGTFVVAATAGDYRVSIAPFLDLGSGWPGGFVPVPKGFENAYVQSIQLGDVDVVNRGVHLDGPTASRLEIVLGMSPGSVQGTVLSQSQSAPGGVTVVLLPNVRGRSDLVRIGTTDSSGAFRLERVAPGDYKAYAWEEVGDGDWHDPDFMRAHEDRGAPVHVVDGTTARVRLTAIAP